MELHEAMEKLGFMKKWQLMIFLSVCFMLEPTPVFHKWTYIFTGYIPKHHCKIPDNSSMQQWIPKDKDGNFESCSMFVNSSVNNITVDCTDGWEYDDKDIGLNLINEWDLVCDKGYYAAYSNMVRQAGEIVAYFLCGLSDIYGRKPIALIFLFLSSVSGIANSFSGSFIILCLTNFFMGCFSVTTAIYPIYLYEMSSKKNRDFITNSASSHWGFMILLTVIIMYISRNWRYLQFITSIYGLLVLPILIWILPETVYWLHANNRTKEAEEVLINAGKLNNVQFTRPVLTLLQTNDFNEVSRTNETPSNTQYSVKELYRNPYLFRHMSFGLFLAFKIFAAMGITVIASAMTKQMYINVFLSSVAEISSGFVAIILLKKCDTKNLMISCSFLAAFSTFICALCLKTLSQQTTNYTTLIFTNLAKFLTSIVWALSYNYSAALFPTNLRNQAIGICYFISRVGMILSSLSFNLLILFPIGTYVLFGLSFLICGLILFVLPYIDGLDLPQTLADIENIYKTDKQSEKMKLLPKVEVISDDDDSNGNT